MAHQLDGHVHHDRLVAEYFEEVKVQDGVRHGVELDVLQNGAVAASVFPVDLHEVNVRRVDQLADTVERDGEIRYDDAHATFDLDQLFARLERAFVGQLHRFVAVEYGGDQSLFAQRLGCFLAEVFPRRAVQIECLHFP